MVAEELKTLLYETGKTLSTAESCTGGAIAAEIVSVSGASNYFKGGVVSYCNEIKERLLGVNPATIEQFDVVSAEVATEMCLGAIKSLQTDYAIAITGCAGPGGGTERVPVGTIWIAYGTKDDIRTYCLTEDNGRKQNLETAKIKAIELLVSYLKS